MRIFYMIYDRVFFCFTYLLHRLADTVFVTPSGVLVNTTAGEKNLALKTFF